MKNKKRILCTIFGGWFGLHKFIDGEIGIGVLYFFTCGLFLVGWICDIVKEVRGDNFSTAPTNIFNNDSISKYAIICPRCKSNNITFQLVAEQKKRGIFASIVWIILCLCTLFLIILIPLLTKKGSKTKKYAICQNCGYSWKFR